MRLINEFGKVVFGSAIALALLSANLTAATIQFLGQCLPTDVSADGSVVVGNLPGSFETFRWTQATGVVPLGRATVPTLGIGAGSPDVSSDGTKVSASILSDSETQMMAGRWTLGSGWQQLGPLPPNSVPSGDDVASAWGMSGDGNAVVGLYWIPSGRAHAYRWTSADGMVELGSDPNLSSRANAANFDGSVVAGWEAAPGGFPGRTPTVWVNGVGTRLGIGLVDSELSSVNGAGTIVGGSWRDAGDPVRGAALWRFDGTNWNLQKLGVLPGTVNDTPGAVVNGLSEDGNIVVGFNRFNIGAQFNTTGFYWSPATGMISANQFISNLGLTLPGDLLILDLTSVSPDGLTITGIGFDTAGYQSFIISVPEPASLSIVGVIGLTLVRRRNRN